MRFIKCGRLDSVAYDVVDRLYTSSDVELLWKNCLLSEQSVSREEKKHSKISQVLENWCFFLPTRFHDGDFQDGMNVELRSDLGSIELILTCCRKLGEAKDTIETA